MTTTMHPLAEDYLKRLASTAHALPPGDRDDLLSEIRSHLQAGLRGATSDADVRNLLHELGDPEDIVAAALSESGPPGPRPDDGPPSAAPPVASPWGTVEILAVLGLTVGMFVVPVLGPWSASCWSGCRPAGPLGRSGSPPASHCCPSSPSSWVSPWSWSPAPRARTSRCRPPSSRKQACHERTRPRADPRRSRRALRTGHRRRLPRGEAQRPPGLTFDPAHGR